MRVRKYTEFIKENMFETPENYVDAALKQLKRKIDKMFDYQESEPSEENYPTEGEEATPERIKKIRTKSKDKMSFEDLGVRLESSEISKYSKLYDSLTVKFSDDNNTYALTITIDIKEAIPKDKEKDFDIDDIEKCYLKFKKYDLDTFEVIGQITKNVEIKKIDEDFLIDLKIELDDKFGDEDEFEIEILRFNESHTKNDYDFEDVFLNVLDYGLNLKLKNIYFDKFSNDNFTSDPNENYTRPGYLIELRNNDGVGITDISTISNIVSELEEVQSRLSETGICIIKEIKFLNNYNGINYETKIEFLLIDGDAKEEKPNDKEGFYDFVKALKRAFRISYNNKVTRSFEYKQGKDGGILTPVGDVDAKQMLNQVKAFLRKFFEPKFHRIGGPNWVYDYNVVLDDNKIFVNYNGRRDRYAR